LIASARTTVIQAWGSNFDHNANDAVKMVGGLDQLLTHGRLLSKHNSSQIFGELSAFGGLRDTQLGAVRRQKVGQDAVNVRPAQLVCGRRLECVRSFRWNGWGGWTYVGIAHILMLLESSSGTTDPLQFSNPVIPQIPITTANCKLLVAPANTKHESGDPAKVV
jgi:hypothetical protein